MNRFPKEFPDTRLFTNRAGNTKDPGPRGSDGRHRPATGELSERSGVTTATVARIEHNEIEPRMTTLLKLTHGLEVDPAELVGDCPVTTPITAQYQHEDFCVFLVHKKKVL